MIDAIIVSGGNIQEGFALDFLKKIREKQKNMPYLIAADKGLEFFQKTGIQPDMVVGDFDSLSEEGNVFLNTLPETKICRLKPEKDDSDTQSAVCLAAEQGAKEIVLLGCLGTRLDHVMANLGILAWGAQKNIAISLYDRYNFVSVVKSGSCIEKKEQFGKYVSFFPFGGEVHGLTLKGFRYPLVQHNLSVCDSGLTVSNEILEEKAEIFFDSGLLLMIMSKD